MEKTLISSPKFIGTPLPSISRHVLPHRRLVSTGVKLSFHKISPIHLCTDRLISTLMLENPRGFLHTLADAVVAVDSTSGDADAVAPQKNGGWYGLISDGMEFVLKVLKDGLSDVHVSYAYGVAIILLTFIVKVATYPLTKQQVESTMAMQNLQPKIKAIQQR